MMDESVRVRSHSTLRFLLGVVLGVIGFGIASFVSLWNQFTQTGIRVFPDSLLPIFACIVIGAVAAIVLVKARLPLAMGIVVGLTITVIVAFVMGMGSIAISAVNPAPDTLLRHGGHSSLVLFGTGTAIATVLWRSWSRRGAPD